MTGIAVDPRGFTAASFVVGDTVATGVDRAWSEVSSVLDACGGMAGDDPVGTRWAAAYDKVAASAARASQDVLNGCFRLAALLEQSGFNYGLAESASTADGLQPTAPDRHDYTGWMAGFAAPPSAVGSGAATPPGWSLIQALIDYAWPNGHQDLLHTAAAGWGAAARELEIVATALPGAIESIAQQHAPEVTAAISLCTAMRRHVDDLSATYAALANACSDFAATLDHAHSQVIEELVSLAKWTAGIQVVAGVTMWFTAGISEVIGQGVQSERIAATAARVAAIIARAIEAANSTAIAIGELLPRVSAVSGDLSVLLDARLAQASVKNVGGMSMSARAEKAAAANLGRSASIRSTWGDQRTLAEHVRKHGRQFGVTSADDYAAAASKFYRRGRRDHLPMKVESDGTMRIYDPRTNTFGVYNADGTTRTLFKPRAGSSYWDKQPGVLQ